MGQAADISAPLGDSEINPPKAVQTRQRLAEPQDQVPWR